MLNISHNQLNKSVDLAKSKSGKRVLPDIISILIVF